MTANDKPTDAEEAKRIGPLRVSLRKLDGLYEKTKKDWYLNVSYSLTEPYAPAAEILPEGCNSTRYSHWGDSIEGAIAAAAEHVYQEIILGKKVGHAAPFTNPDDHKNFKKVFGVEPPA